MPERHSEEEPIAGKLRVRQNARVHGAAGAWAPGCSGIGNVWMCEAAQKIDAQCSGGDGREHHVMQYSGGGDAGACGTVGKIMVGAETWGAQCWKGGYAVCGPWSLLVQLLLMQLTGHVALNHLEVGQPCSTISRTEIVLPE